MKLPIEQLVSCATKVRPCGCAHFASKPAITRMEDGFKLATEFIGDTCHFSQVDRSLEPNFLKGLLKIEGKDPMDTARLITDEFLKIMGFKDPRALKLKFEKSKNTLAYFEATTGALNIDINSIDSKEQIIATLRHELEHMLQYIKVYKAKGKKALLNKPSDSTIVKILKRIMFNNRFYKKMSKDVSLDGFDVEKYYKAILEYKGSDNSFESNCKYYSNILEKEANAVQKKVLEALGQDSRISIDFYPANYLEIEKLLENQKIPKEQYQTLINKLNALALLKQVETPENTEKYFRILKDVYVNKKDVSMEDFAWLKDISDRFKKTVLEKLEGQTMQKGYQQIEAWLREGKFTIEDVLKDM